MNPDSGSGANRKLTEAYGKFDQRIDGYTKVLIKFGHEKKDLRDLIVNDRAKPSKIVSHRVAIEDARWRTGRVIAYNADGQPSEPSAER